MGLRQVILDTSTCIDVNRTKKERSLRTAWRVNRARSSKVKLLVSSVTLFELHVGCYLERHKAANAEALAVLLEFVTVADFDSRAAAHTAAVKYQLRHQPIGPYDTMIAGHALALGVPLITGNLDEFERVNGLTVEDWGADDPEEWNAEG